MAERIAEIVILAEDSNQANLARHYLKRLGHDNRNITLKISSSGSGEQFVRERFPDELAAYRAQNRKRRSALVVLIDADNLAVDERLRQLDSELSARPINRRDNAERVAVLAPKRNVETWILCLHGEEVDEETVYRKRAVDGATIKAAANTLHSWSRPNAQVPGHCVESLRVAFPELRRLD